MKRRALALLLVGWLLGLATAIVVPAVRTERRTVDLHEVTPLVRDGWVVTRAGPSPLVTLERSRIRLQ
jgi:hypothetical protein